MNHNQIIDGLNLRQKEAVKSIYGETLVIAGAGSGKTAVLTRRCAYLIAEGARPGSILSLTFTNKAAAEMNQRIRKLLFELGYDLPFTPTWSLDYTNSPLFCTFHSLGVRLLREFGELVGVPKTFTILDKDDQLKLIKDTQKSLNIDPKVMAPNYAVHFISQCKQELLVAANSHKYSKDFLPVFHQVYKVYEERCRANGVVDFDDLILMPYLVLKNHLSARIICQERWRHIQVDEFQDINVAQFELVGLLYKEIKKA